MTGTAAHRNADVDRRTREGRRVLMDAGVSPRRASVPGGILLFLALSVQTAWFAADAGAASLTEECSVLASDPLDPNHVPPGKWPSEIDFRHAEAICLQALEEQAALAVAGQAPSEPV